ncbi:hypothetical protein VTO42DRAFT_5515 [Malbranchea cinnamomea]
MQHHPFQAALGVCVGFAAVMKLMRRCRAAHRMCPGLPKVLAIEPVMTILCRTNHPPPPCQSRTERGMRKSAAVVRNPYPSSYRVGEREEASNGGPTSGCSLSRFGASVEFRSTSIPPRPLLARSPAPELPLRSPAISQSYLSHQFFAMLLSLTMIFDLLFLHCILHASSSTPTT